MRVLTNEEVLKRLYELKASKDRDSYLEYWIEDMKIMIAKDSFTDIGIANAMDTWRNWIRHNRSENVNHVPALMKASGILPRYVFTTDHIIVTTKNDMYLPTSIAFKQRADMNYGYVASALRTHKTRLHIPDWFEIDTEIKIAKAAKVSKPRYSFGKGLPTVDAIALRDMRSVFENGVAYYNPSLGERSTILFQFTTIDGLLLPL